jgi:hypothetical protein
MAADWPALGSTVRVVGVLGTDDRDQDEGRGPRIENRNAGDVSVISTPASHR